jgi:signal transduction histidine kinase/DNA-binding response OmpR family regulator
MKGENVRKQALMKFAILSLGLLFCLFSHLYLQARANGCKYLKNYSTGKFPQNWWFVQDQQGVIYAANNAGVRVFDGVSWRHIDVPNLNVRSLALDEKGTIYVGGIDEFGFLAPDSRGSLQYVSLLRHLKDNQKNFSKVWRVSPTKEGVYFRTKQYLFRWNPDLKRMKVWKSRGQARFDASFTCGGKLFIHQRNIGLMQMIDDSLRMIPGNETFAAVKIYMMVPYQNRKILIGTRSKGLFIYDRGGMSTIPFPTGADDYLKENQLNHGIGLASSPGLFALATLRGGLVILNSRGGLKEIFTKSSGLQNDSIKCVYEDFQGNLWLALEKGIAKIEYNSPISIYDEDRANLAGIVLSVVRHGSNNGLYVGTTRGLYFLADAGKGQFHPISETIGNCWHFLSTKDSLFVAATNGVFQVSNNNVVKRGIINIPSYAFRRSRREPRRVWVGTQEGLVSLYSWEMEHHFEDIKGDITTIVEDREGNLWLGTTTNGIFRMVFPGDGGVTNPGVTNYGTAHGLPAREANNVFFAAGHLIFATQKGIFRFDEKKKAFLPDKTLGDQFANGSRSVAYITEDRNKHIWFHSDFKNFLAVPQADGDFKIMKNSLLRLPQDQVNFIYLDPREEHITWFAANESLIRYDTTVKKNYHQDFLTFIRKVLVSGKTIFEGHRAKSIYPVIDYKDRNLRFEFAAPFFEAEKKTQYQCLLEGYDSHWSAWNNETWENYTNLDDGVYTFRVRAKNVYENLSREAIFQFKVLPPWYQTWWAYLIYTFLTFLGVYFIVKWRSWKLVREKQKLEQVIRERTTEINEKNLQLEEQSEKLKEMDQIKSRFFANISHEFRTPLTLIMGPIEQRLSLCRDKQQEKELQMMLRNSQRLLNLINQLLDLSKLDSGKMKLQAARQNIIPFLKGLVGSFESLVVQKPLDLTFQTEEENILLYYDPEKLEKVICNLVSNAVKFTPPKGKITVSAKKYNAVEVNYPKGYLEILFRDTGIGIPGNQLIHIFDRFYQADGSLAHEHHQKGSGIGLALVKELVTLHHGDISVQSSEGKGTEFIIRLPLGKTHLKPEEIFESVGPVEDVEPEALVYQREQEQPLAVQGDDMIEKDENRVEESGADDPGEEEKNVILVVDDSSDVRTFIKSSLESFYTIVEAADGGEGIDKARAIIPDLIVSDVMMPNVDGFELCRVLKTDIDTSHIPVVLLTAKASEESIIEGLETGADDYITKPFNTKILLTRIKNLIDLRRQLQEKIQREMMMQPTEIAVSSMDQEFMKGLKKAVEKNMSEEEFGVDELAKGLYMSRATLNRKLRALTGESTNQFIQSYRLKRAAQLLKTNFGNVTEVAFEVGFSNSAYFSKCFKDKFHQLPHTFQASES